jgi:hypothetical protein
MMQQNHINQLHSQYFFRFIMNLEKREKKQKVDMARSVLVGAAWAATLTKAGGITTSGSSLSN